MSRQSPPPDQGSTPPTIFNSQQPSGRNCERTADSRASLRSGKQMVICINPFLSLSLVDAIEYKCLIYRSEYRAVKDESRLALHLAVRNTSILGNEELVQSHAFKRKKKKYEKSKRRIGRGISP